MPLPKSAVAGIVVIAAALGALLVLQACSQATPQSVESSTTPSSDSRPMPSSQEPPAMRPNPTASGLPAMDLTAPMKVETAIFSLGCFWGVESHFGAIPGVIRTRVGYCGGSTPDPTYHAISDYTESVAIDFDPTVVTYRQLLDDFWASHNPCDRPYSEQYKSVVFWSNDDQKKQALESRDRVAATQRDPVRTQVLAASVFYNAETYHQKYYLRQNRDLMSAFAKLYPNPADFNNSTAAARIDGYLGGNGSPEQLAKELPSLGLTPDLQAKLTAIVASHPAGSCGLGH